MDPLWDTMGHVGTQTLISISWISDFDRPWELGKKGKHATPNSPTSEVVNGVEKPS